MKFEIKNRVITGEDTLIVGDNSDYIAEFNFDEEWNGVTKTARFVSCPSSSAQGGYVDQLIENNKCCIPCEVLKCGFASVGVYSAEMTTTKHKFFVTESIKNETGCECEPTPNIYEQLTGKLDDIQAQMPNEVETQVTDYFEEHKDDFKGEKGDRGEAGAIKFIVVNELPTENIDLAAIYLKPSSDPDNQNAYDEFVYINNVWECIGTANVKVDLTDYVKNTDISTTIFENNTYVGKAGLFLYDGNSVGGLFKSTAGGNVKNAMRIKKATFADINNRTPNTYHDSGVASANQCCPIVPANFDYAFKRALLDDKLNGFVYDGVDYSWTDEEKAQARSFLGVPQIELTLKDNGAYTLTINKG